MSVRQRSIPENGRSGRLNIARIEQMFSSTKQSASKPMSQIGQARHRRALHRAKAIAYRRLDADANLCPSVRFLAERSDIHYQTLETASKRALANGTTAAEELTAAGYFGRQDYARWLAEAAGCRHLKAEDIKCVMTSASSVVKLLQPSGLRWTRLHDDTVVAVDLVNPRSADVVLKLVRSGHLRSPVCIMAPDDFKAASLSQHAEAICELQSEALFHTQPEHSARTGASFSQGVLLSLLAGLVAFAFLSTSSAAILILHVILTSFFIGCVAVRIAAAMHPRQSSSRVEASEDFDKPVYSVMVTLLDEAAVVPGLIHHLSALRWPTAKLEIKLVCEENDHATIAAIEQACPDSRFEIIRVPSVGPKTKPKALSYALPFTTGELVTLYDAEDRPHPMQLEQAWQRFKESDASLACLQAPLTVANAHRNPLTALFHLEYAGLFKRLLPWLSAMRCPLPLGGTSNHFRREALTAVGGWDPYNVTEDADLGYRLWRHGYRTETITLPTLEDAPARFGTWLPQRTRWFKGWMQTWLVHTRESRDLFTRTGFLPFVVTHVIMSGVILSSLLHPLMLANAVILTLWLLTQLPENPMVMALAVVDWSAILLSYIAFLVLGWQATSRRLRRKIWYHVVWLVPYWIALSYASWRALWQIFRKPYYWEKTEHERYDPLHPHGRDQIAQQD